MEELHSTEILEREILEDARKKALRFLKTAEDTVRAGTAEWEKKTAQSIKDLENKYNKQREIIAEKTMARLPIDKLRVKTEKIEELLLSVEDAWYKKLSREQLIKLLTAELSKRLVLCKDIESSAEKKAYYNGLDQKEAETILKTAGVKFSLEEVKTENCYPSITLETENVRIIASIQKIIDFYLDEKREELIEALTGRAFLEGEI